MARLAMESAAISPGDLEFSWVETLRERGLWDGPVGPTDLMDLWLDVERSLFAIDQWANSAKPDASFRQLNQDAAFDLHQLSGLERSGMWGLAL
jgi:hypothetical protein